MTGAMFEFFGTESSRLSGLQNLTLVFEGGNSSQAEMPAEMEVGGADLGSGDYGFLDNFALGTLQVGGEIPAELRLVDLIDNQPDRQDAEVLYVDHLIVGPGSTLDLNGLNLYYGTAEIAAGANIIDGAMIHAVPEPSTIALLIFGIAAMTIMRFAPSHRHRN